MTIKLPRNKKQSCYQLQKIVIQWHNELTMCRRRRVEKFLVCWSVVFDVTTTAATTHSNAARESERCSDMMVVTRLHKQN